MKTSLVLLAAVFSLIGCSSHEPTSNSVDLVIEVPGTVGYVREVVLPSGTHCAVLVGVQKGGISCSWTEGK